MNSSRMAASNWRKIPGISCSTHPNSVARLSGHGKGGTVPLHDTTAHLLSQPQTRMRNDDLEEAFQDETSDSSPVPMSPLG